MVYAAWYAATAREPSVYGFIPQSDVLQGRRQEQESLEVCRILLVNLCFVPHLVIMLLLRELVVKDQESEEATRKKWRRSSVAEVR